MATGTVTLHSWNEGADGQDDEAEPPMGSNYNSRLDMREDYNAAGQRNTRNRETGRGLRSRVVRPVRLGMDDEDDEEVGRVPGAW